MPDWSAEVTFRGLDQDIVVSGNEVSLNLGRKETSQDQTAIVGSLRSLLRCEMETTEHNVPIIFHTD